MTFECLIIRMNRGHVVASLQGHSILVFTHLCSSLPTSVFNQSWPMWLIEYGMAVCGFQGQVINGFAASSLLDCSFWGKSATVMRFLSSPVEQLTWREMEASCQQLAPVCQPCEWPPWKWILQAKLSFWMHVVLADIWLTSWEILPSRVF